MEEKNKQINALENFVKDMIERKRNHVDTPSEKICKFSIERDKVYDKIKYLNKDIEMAEQNGEDTSFTVMQVKQLEVYKNMLGDHIKKLIDET